MDFFHLGLIAFQIIILCVFATFLRRFSRQKKVLHQENLNNKRYFSKSLEESTLEVFDKIEELQYELGDVHQQMMKFLQQQVSWRTVKKELPDSLYMVLLLKNKTKSEHKGFLNKIKDTWTIQSLGSSDQNFSLEEISHWKPIVSKQNDAKS